MTTPVVTALVVLTLGLWLLVDPRGPLWIADQNERISRQMYALLRAEPPEYAYRLSRLLIRWVLPAVTIAASISILLVGLI